jgi:hypothetical protein
LCPSQNLVVREKRSLYPATKVGELNVNNVVNTGGETFLIIKLISVERCIGVSVSIVILN